MLSWVGTKWAVVLLMGVMVSSGVYMGFFSHDVQFSQRSQAKVLFDFTKDEDAGNADWRIDGAYSSFAQALKNAGFSVGEIGTGHGTITSQELQGCKVLIIPEPQDKFTSSERSVILNFVSNGGSLIYIADHPGSDRNHNGYSSWKIWNNNLNFDSVFGITLLSTESGKSGHKITDIENVPVLTDGVSAFGMWEGATMSVSGNAKAVAYQNIGGVNYAVMAYAYYGSGRVIVFGDSSTFDDGTPDSANHHDNVYDGWSKYNDATLGIDMVRWASQGVNNSHSNVPGAPQNLAAVSGNGYVKLTWNSPATGNATWHYATSTSFDGGYGEAMAWDGHYIYILRQKDSDSSPMFYRYDPQTGTWTDLSSGLPNVPFENGVAMAYDYHGHIYVLTGGSYRSNGDRVYFYMYSISSNTWSRLADAPHVEGPGDAIVYSGYDHMIYAFLGRAHYIGSYNPGSYSIFARYNPSTDTWEKLSFPSWWPDEGTDDGASLAWTGGRYIYGLEGEFYENSPLRGFARYDIVTNKWVKMQDIPDPEGVGDGGSLLWLGHYYPSLSNVIFALGGNGCNETPGYYFFEYNIPTNTWIHLHDLPYPVGDFVGNRLGYADGKIFYWQGTPNTWNGGGKRIYYYPVPASSNGNVSVYRIYRGTSSGGETYLAEVNGSSLSYTDRSVTNGVTYYYYVTAVNSAGESDKSNEVSATPHKNTVQKLILFVDDDGGKSYSNYVQEAISDSGYSFDTWDVNAKGYPTFADFQNYRVVVWTTGSMWRDVLNSEEQSALEKYLNDGGKLYISSQDLLWDLNDGNDGNINNNFVSNYLGVSGVRNDQDYKNIYGVSNDPITSSFSSISLKFPFTNYADEITPGHARGIFTDANGNYVASRYDSGTFRTVFTAFPFEAVELEDSDTGAELMKSIITWLLNGSTSGNNVSVPGAPLDLRATGGNGEVHLEWNPPDENGGSVITEYRIYRGTSSGGETYLAEVNGSSLSYTDRSVTNGVTYYYYVTAVNSAGESENSNEVNATPSATMGLLSNKILFVDDDDGSIYSEYVEDALNNSYIKSRFEVYEWDVYQIGRTPTYKELEEYGIVVWSTGYAYKDTLTDDDQDNLMKYLDAGGRLYLTSQDFLWEVSDGYDGSVYNQFVNDYLGVTGVTNDVGYNKVYGVSGDPITGNLAPVPLQYPFHNYDDRIQIASGAHAIFKDSKGYAVGDRYSSENFRVVFTAFSFEAIDKYDSENGIMVMNHIISWLAS